MQGHHSGFFVSSFGIVKIAGLVEEVESGSGRFLKAPI